MPWLPALSAQSKSRPFRFGAIYVPNGIYPQLWHPDKTGSDFEFKPIMKPLEPYRDYVLTISKMKAPDGNPENGGVHMGASAAFLNGVGPLTKQAEYTVIRSKKTVDQYIADKVAEDTPMRSLQVGTEDMGTSAGACDGYPCVFFNTVSWRDDSSPLPMGINPRVTFERMFGETGSAKKRLSNLTRKQKMLDSITEETAAMRRKLGPADNAILDEYLNNVRDVEQQLERMESRAGSRSGRRDGAARNSRHVRRAHDSHLRSDAPGVPGRYFACVYLYGRARRQQPKLRPYRHSRTASSGLTSWRQAGSIEKYAKLTTYHVVETRRVRRQTAKSTADGDGTLLDRSLIYFGSGMSNGNAHDRNNPPAAVVGGANGRLKGNRHIAVENKEPTANLLLAFADMANTELEQIGHSTGRLSL